jgi:multicomponent K+:H+ antiporter subunit A
VVRESHAARGGVGPARCRPNIPTTRRVTGLGSLVVGYPLLTTHTAHVSLPVIGDLHLPTAAVFDVGVFAVVLGSSMLLLTALGHQSLRARKRGTGMGR